MNRCDYCDYGIGISQDETGARMCMSCLTKTSLIVLALLTTPLIARPRIQNDKDKHGCTITTTFYDDGSIESVTKRCPSKTATATLRALRDLNRKAANYAR